MASFKFLADRTAVLFLGVAAGTAIGYAFAGGGDDVREAAAVPVAAAPPPPAAEPAPGPAPAGTPPAPIETAAPPPAPAIPDVPQSNDALAQSLVRGGRVRVGVFGDSFGDGVWSGLYRLLPASAGYDVVKYSQQSTGFTRYRSLNLEEHLREQLAGNPVDIAVISFGANDTQGVLVGGHAARLMGEEWQQVVGDRIAGYVGILRGQGAMVYWLGLPRMRKAGFDADIQAMNAFYARKMAELGVPFVATAALTVDGEGQYAPYLPDGPDGKRTLIRANDGIHMSMTGYVRITRGLAAKIRQTVAEVRPVGAVAEPAS